MDTLESLRNKIDIIDTKVIELLGKRFCLVAKVGMYKKKYDIPIKDKKREEEKLTKLTTFAKKHNLDTLLIQNIWKKIFKHSYSIENK